MADLGSAVFAESSEGAELRSQRPPSFFQGARGTIAAVGAFSAIANLLLLVVPFYSNQLFDRVLGSGSVETLLFLSLVAVIALIFYGIFEFIRSRLLVRLAGFIEQKYGAAMLKRELAHGAHRDDDRAQPLSDLRDLAAYLGSPSFLNLLDAPWCPAFVILIWLIHPALGAIALAAAIFFIALGLLSDRLTREPAKLARSAHAIQSDVISQFRRNAELARAMGYFEAFSDRWDELIRRSGRINLKSGDRVAAAGSLARFLRLMAQVAMTGAGIYLILRQELTPGILIATTLLFSRALAPLEQSIGAVRQFNTARIAYRRLCHELALIEDSHRAMRLADPRGTFAVDQVTVAVDGRKQPILDQISLQATVGEAIAVIGPSGSGKSTLIRVLSGITAPTRGSVRIDGSRIVDWPEDQLGAAIGYLPQDVDLMTGTVAENIGGMQLDVDADGVRAAATAAGIDDLIQSLPKGFNTIVGPHGVQLSGGQRQRIGLARALYGDRKLLLLDEPDAHLDDAGQSRLKATITSLKQSGRVVVFTTHRRSMLDVATRLVVLVDGQISAAQPAKPVSPPAIKAARPEPAPAAAPLTTPPKTPPDPYNPLANGKVSP